MDKKVVLGESVCEREREKEREKRKRERERKVNRL